MNAQEIKTCRELASNPNFTPVEADVLFGIGMKGFVPVCTTAEVVATFLRWQCLCLNGSWDSESLNEMAYLLRHRVTLI